MRINNLLILSKFKLFISIILSVMICNIQINEASALTGEEVLSKLDTKAQYHYVSGVIGGIAYSRFLRDKPSENGMKCMLNWWNKADDITAWKITKKWLEHHKEKTTEVILYAILSKKCGK